MSLATYRIKIEATFRFKVPKHCLQTHSIWRTGKKGAEKVVRSKCCWALTFWYLRWLTGGFIGCGLKITISFYWNHPNEVLKPVNCNPFLIRWHLYKPQSEAILLNGCCHLNVLLSSCHIYMRKKPFSGEMESWGQERKKKSQYLHDSSELHKVFPIILLNKFSCTRRDGKMQSKIHMNQSA